MDELCEGAEISFADPKVQACPFHAYATLRQESPVYHDPVTGNYILTRYDDVRRGSLNVKALRNKTGLVSTRSNAEANRIYAEKGWLPMDTLVSADPPEHRFYRKLVDKVFTSTRVTSLEPRISQLIEKLIDDLEDKAEIEFLDAFAVKLPLLFIAEQLGVPGSDMGLFKLWSDVSVEASSPILPDEREVEIAEITVGMQQYLVKEIQRVRAHPNNTLISDLANTEVDGVRLDLREILSIVHQILVAGNETTTTTLASGMMLLIKHPELAAQLHDEPSRVKTFIEETLRVMSPVQAMFRRVAEDVTISGVTIPAGALVEMRYGSANRDPDQYDRPDEIDLDRANASSHLAFGAGPHICIGNQLARGELRLAFQALTRRLTNFRTTRGDDSYGWMTGYITYGPRRMWMSFDRR